MFEDVDEGHVDGDDSLHFFYNRQKRLENAPQIVRDYYDGKMNPPRGFFKVLVSTKANKFLFLTLVVLTAFAMIYTRVMGASAKGEVDGVKCELSSFAYDEEVFTSVKVTCENEKLKDPKVLTVHFYLSDVNSQLIYEEETQLLIQKTEDFVRLKTTDYELREAKAVVKLGAESIQLEASVKR